MALSSDLISQFVKITKDETSDKKETIVYGTVHKEDSSVFVKIDGSNVYTPVSTTSDTAEGERVIVMIKDHKAVITGNASSPSARSEDVKNLEIVVADKVSTSELEAQNAVIENLKSDNVTITGKLTAAEANIETLQTDKLDASEADIKYATIENLNAANANIENLQTDKLSVSDANIKYATIDFTNIGKAAIEQFFSKSGMISNLVVGESTITGKLVGVTISGDSIEANTIKADKLVVLGSDGLYYKLNVNALGEATASSDEKYQNGLDGSAIIAKTITATQISVHDLVAFGATIGGFHITEDSIYSGVKESAGITTRGIYFDNDGQFVVGDSSNYIKFFKDTDDTYKLDISAKSIKFGSSGKSVEDEVNSLRDEITTLLRIESSRGTVFKNDNISTVLSVVIYHGTQRITDSDTMKSVFGSGAYLQWKWQRLDDDAYGVISSSDSRFSNNGFSFTLSPEDVNTKVTFMCELIV